MEIIQIIPRLPPAIDGVGDYSFLLAKQLRAAHDIHTHFIVCDPEWKPDDGSQWADVSGQMSVGRCPISGRQSPALLDGFPIHQMRERSAKELLRVLSKQGMPITVLLQYVGYGYEKRGCPVWLVSGLRAWLKADGRSAIGDEERTPHFECRTPNARCLATMFHELYAFGPPWGSAFWSSPVQRWIAKILARISSHCFTNMKMRATTLQKFNKSSESNYTVLPVFSNVGEPEQLPVWRDRQHKMIVFGRAESRRKIYAQFKSKIETVCRIMDLSEIVDIGVSVEIPQLLVRVSRLGVLSSAETSREMLAARAGCFTYPTDRLGKSGIFAAYAVHGLVPVVFDENRVENMDGLVLGENFLSPVGETLGCEIEDFEKIGKRTREWYDEHSVTKQAAIFAENLRCLNCPLDKFPSQ